jgi:DNA-binding MarR family transcriptional regulator
VAVLRSRKHLASLHPGLTAKLTPSKLRALDLLSEQDLRVGQLAAGIGIDDTTATRLVDRLEAMGLVDRRVEPGDRRVTTVALTLAGEELVAGIAAQRQLFFCDVLDGLEPDERAELVRLTAKASESLRARSEELVSR